jgi:sigma-E factor negative regulatory protein RseA
MRAQQALREAWATYHLIGDALRQEPCAECKVLDAVAQRLVQETTVVAPRRTPLEAGRRWALPSLAAAAAVASVSWIATQRSLDDAGGMSLAPVAHTVVPAVGSALPFQDYLQPVNLQQASPPAIQLQAREIDAYLMAHQQFSPSTTMHGLAPYARTVSPASAETGR